MELVQMVDKMGVRCVPRFLRELARPKKGHKEEDETITQVVERYRHAMEVQACNEGKADKIPEGATDICPGNKVGH